MKSFLFLFFSLTFIATLNSCKNKRTRTCHLVDVAAQDTVEFYRQDGLFNKHAERECEEEADRRDTLEQYFGTINWCYCVVGRE